MLFIIFYIQFCINNSLHVADNFYKTVLLECVSEWYQVYHYVLAYYMYTMTVLLEYIDFHKSLILQLTLILQYYA